MASNTGTAILDFGVNPGSVSTFVSSIDLQTSTDAYCSAWFYSDQNVDVNGLVLGTNHTYIDHQNISLFCSLSCGFAVNPYGFYIFAQTLEPFTGTFKVQWAWTDGI